MVVPVLAGLSCDARAVTENGTRCDVTQASRCDVTQVVAQLGVTSPRWWCSSCGRLACPFAGVRVRAGGERPAFGAEHDLTRRRPGAVLWRRTERGHYPSRELVGPDGARTADRFPHSPAECWPLA